MRQRELIIISVTIFLTVVAWIIADLVHIFSTQQIKVDTSLQQELKVSVDTTIFDTLRSRP